MKDIKHGFIITYFKSNPESEKLLFEMVKTISRMDVYLVLASHSFDVPVEIQQLCDFYFYQELNIVDNRKYSHGVAENNLIEIALNHLNYKEIDWTFKTSYDVLINDSDKFYDWIKDYQYDLVSCKWGENFLATHSFFANVNFLLENIVFYKNVEEMFSVNNILENCWQKNIEDKNLRNRVFTFDSKESFYGTENKIDVAYYNYNKLDFWYSHEENKFYCVNNGNYFKGKVRIFDYYSDLCLYELNDFEHHPNVTMWFIPPYQESVPLSKNGWYIEYFYPEMNVKSNFGIKNFSYREPLRKSFNIMKSTSEIKYHEYSELSEFDLYQNENFNFDLSSVRNYVDLGANFGLGGVSFIRNRVKCYLIEPDEYNLSILESAYGKNSKVKIYPHAVCDVDGTIDFYVQKNCSVISSLYELNANGGVTDREKIKVPAMTPNTLIEKYVDEDYVDLIKIDIEGAEYVFFNVISDKNIKKINRMIIEFHNNDNYEVLGIIKKLTKNDFQFKLGTWGSFTNPYIIENKMGIIYAWR